MGDITPFAESLLSQQRQRNEDERKRQERRANKAILGKIGLGIAERVGNELLAQQTQEFMNSTEFKSARQLARQGDNARARLEKELAEIRASEMEPIEYLVEQAKPILEAELNLETPYKDRGTQYYEGTIYKGAREIADERWRILTEAEKIWQDQNISAEEERVRLIAQEFRPDTVRDLIASKISSFVSGRDGQDADIREILSLKDYANSKDGSSRAFYLEELKRLDEEFRKSGDLPQAKKIIKQFNSAKSDPANETVDVEEFDTQESSKGMFYRTKTTTTYKLNSDGTRGEILEKTKDFVKGADQKPEVFDPRTEKELVRGHIESFDYDGFMEDGFSSAGKIAFARLLMQEGSVPLSEIETFDQLKSFERAFFTIASNPTSYEADSTQLAIFEAALEDWNGEKGTGYRLLSQIRDAEGRGAPENEIRALQQNYLRELSRFKANLNNVIYGTDEDTFTFGGEEFKILGSTQIN